MLTPAKYWRVPCSLDQEVPQPPSAFSLPPSLANQATPPTRGHGIAMAAYDEANQTGIVRWLGIISGGNGTVRTVEWKPTSAQIWVDTPKGRSYWLAGAFGFAQKKIADYGLHELWQQHFEGMELRATTPMNTTPTGLKSSKSNAVSQERLNPMEVVGGPSDTSSSGVVYVLKSAYGYKVGRTRNVPSRMRTFGIQLPFIYTIPLCVWFDDHYAAERRYHGIFANKRINGEWFDLTEDDIDLIRHRR